MEIGFVGLGRMGLNMVRRLVPKGHRVVAFDRNAEAVAEAASVGAVGAPTLHDLVQTLEAPRTIWVMVPSGDPTEETLQQLADLCQPGDIVIDGGNSNYKDSIRRGEMLRDRGIQFLDAGTSGGIWGLKEGYCLMVGGEAVAVEAVKPAFLDLAPLNGFAHVGPSGAGHFSKMIHNGIEYGMMQAYAEGFEILEKSRYDYDLRKLADLWNHGSVVRSWLLELAERAFAQDPHLEEIAGYVEDSGEGRWTVQEAMDLSVPAPVITLSLQTRFRSRQQESFTAKILAALRSQFGGHAVKTQSGASSGVSASPDATPVGSGAGGAKAGRP